MDLLSSLTSEFPPRSASLTDEYIEQNPDPVCAAPLNDWLAVMPAYMSWCIRNPHRNELLVLDHTVDALANFGRFARSEPPHLNFKSKCSPGQRAVVAAFLAWCLSGSVLVNEDQASRSLRHWQRA